MFTSNVTTNSGVWHCQYVFEVIAEEVCFFFIFIFVILSKLFFYILIAAPLIMNGVIERSSISHTYGLIGDTIIYRCLPRFQLNGPQVVTCGSYGWSSQPRCLGEQVTPAPGTNQSLSSCGPHPMIDNGRIISYGDAAASNEISWVAYECFDNYVLVGYNRVMCVAGMWTDTPRCERVTSPNCANPPPISNGYIVEWSIASMSSVRGNRAIYACHHSYTLDGNPQVYCINNQWGPLPQCIPDTR